MKQFQPNTNYEAFKKGCPHAFEAIYRQYHRSVYWMGRSILKDVYTVENILQDTFLILWQKRDRIQSLEHLHAFVHFVMKSECIYQYSKPRNAFQRNLSRLEYFENYQDYLWGYERDEQDAHLMKQNADQQALDQIQKLLPLLGSKRKLLVELCLKYGFQYKAIAQAMGTSTAKTSIEIKAAIEDIKNILGSGCTPTAKAKPIRALKNQGTMTPEQEKILNLRMEKHYSFAVIATELNRSLKEVHHEFMIAYKWVQLKQDQPQSA
ncbi:MULTISPECIES: sigma-70 family RNA polymerase sigma factor [unclassified Leeuwenhoekiella]|uniref:RNA polymerase sigma factor n=1 Tax=unclassified Leeuwenhoekiella TaxID=2615029 RepID=UPI000C4AEB9B|nr:MULTISPECIES: sigma-70 family RNA polymerase sigma factor [unclassified Leeuwenhoekiella]MAW95680.1 RNA polymerase [Leeuwenhoekiella sp.]MBA79889.1 RNA polymerase [Leeuwenhoekiella sp.]|tara:strand:- start:8763 stop:9557 length:795 start_codon:yes stop_codon:yes gene_type:complete